MNTTARVCYLLKHINLTYVRLMDQRLANIGLTQAQGEILFLLWQDETLSQNDLRVRLGVTAPTLSGLIDAMAAKGLIVRETHRQDPRKNVLRLTPKARALKEEYMTIKTNVTSSFQESMTNAEMEVLAQWLEKLLANLQRQGQ